MTDDEPGMDGLQPDLPVELEEEFDEGIPYEEPVGDLPPREFKGWHRPRKHRVRTAQWLGAFKSLLTELLPVNHRRESINYFGLPGSDLIDVSMFATECERHGVLLRYLGLDRSAGEGTVEGIHLNITREELRRSGKVHRESDVLPDEFTTLSHKTSPAYLAAREMSFDVVNLDFCGSATNDPPGVPDTLYAGVRGLLKIQMERDDPWVLLLTGTFDRTGQGRAGQLNAVELIEALKHSIEECGGDVVAAAQNAFDAVDNTFPDVESCPDQVFNHLHVLAFVHWICDIGKQHRTASFRLASVMSYRLHASRPAPDMFSIALLIRPTQPHIQDRAKLLPPALAPNHCAELQQRVERMASVRDVDAELVDNQELFQSLQNDMADILSKLRYDRDVYLKSEYSKHIGEASDVPADVGQP
jgi:hypothetical protein